MLGKKLGKRAMLVGAIAQSIPDVDFIASFWNDTATNLLAHRGFTHSIVFAILTAFSMAFIIRFIFKSHKLNFGQLLLFIGIELTIHILLDLMNNYGVGLFEPFSHIRVSFHTLYVADPFFTLWPFIAALALLLIRSFSDKRKFWHRFAIKLSGFYLV